MVFDSLTFLLFLVVVVCSQYLVRSWRARKLFLLVASYVFYAAWNPPFVLLLWLSTVVDWVVARRVHASRSAGARRSWLFVSLGVNLGLLGFFKYGTFLLDAFVDVAAAVGVHFSPAAPNVVLPVGISFYTFQTLSYTLDVYRGTSRPWHSFLDYALYVTFFPQLVAGPIVRAQHFLPQCVEPRTASGPQLGWGLVLFVVGLFQKVVVADGLLAPVVETVFDGGAPADTLSAWCGTLAFAGQIFSDFAGYSSCAIGVALCLGFEIPDNFHAPYAASGFSDFWRRWHISLSSWLRDYLYISLGGNRISLARTHVNLMLTMLIGGLWHGASWTFVFWGGLHGAYLSFERILRDRVSVHVLERHAAGRLLIGAVTFAFVCVAWVFFRADTFDVAFAMASGMLGMPLADAQRLVAPRDAALTFAVMGCLVGFHWMRRNETFEAVGERVPWWVVSIALAAMGFAIATMPGEDRAFIYFQF